jgi:hypothetical protein
VLLLTITLLEKAGHGSRALKATDRDTLGWKEASVMDRPWFDRESGTLILDEYLLEMDSYLRIVEDEAITDEELVEQTQRVASLLRQLEESLSPEAKAIATAALGELAVLICSARTATLTPTRAARGRLRGQLPDAAI